MTCPQTVRINLGRVFSVKVITTVKNVRLSNFFPYARASWTLFNVMKVSVKNKGLLSSAVPEFH
jgi:hypothetical protein